MIEDEAGKIGLDHEEFIYHAKELNLTQRTREPIEACGQKRKESTCVLER